jgi:hypothetical protein
VSPIERGLELSGAFGIELREKVEILAAGHGEFERCAL